MNVKIPKSGNCLQLAQVWVCVVRGAWCVVRGAWCVVRGAWYVVRVFCAPEEQDRVPTEEQKPFGLHQ
jgi:hypothetical protein